LRASFGFDGVAWRTMVDPRPDASSPQARVVALLLISAAVAAAAALLLLRLHFQPPTVPDYSLAGDASGERELARGSTFVMDLRPEGPVAGAVGARAFLVQDDAVRPWDVPFTVMRDGSVRIEAASDAIFAGVPAGAWEVAVAVGRPENLPTDPRDVLRARAATTDAGAAWHLVRERVRWSG
jgi:hypothetical protein